MKALILGTSSKTSIGYHIGRSLTKMGYEVIYASRSGRLGEKCDVTDYAQLKELLDKVHPDTIIDSTGVFSHPDPRSKTDLDNAREHLSVKSFGSFVLIRAILDAESRSVKNLIMVGGRKNSCSEEFGAYAIANGATWSAVEFLTKYHKLTCTAYYLDLPAIRYSTMVNKSNLQHTHVAKPEEVNIADVNKTVKDILSGKYMKGSRVMVQA